MWSDTSHVENYSMLSRIFMLLIFRYEYFEKQIMHVFEKNVDVASKLLI